MAHQLAHNQRRLNCHREVPDESNCPSIAVAICMMSPASVRADSITITSGSVAFASVRGSDGLRGTLNGDAFSMSFSWGGAVILPCPCPAGDAVTLSSSAHAPNTLNTEGLDNDAMGTAIIGGTLYTGLAFVGDLSFVGPTFTLPALPPVDPGPFQFLFCCLVRSR